MTAIGQARPALWVQRLAACKATVKPFCFVSRRALPAAPQLRPYLHNTADDHGEDIQGKTKDVEQGQGHKGFLGIQDVVLIDGHVDGKSTQGHLQAEPHH